MEKNCYTCKFHHVNGHSQPCTFFCHWGNRVYSAWQPKEPTATEALVNRAFDAALAIVRDRNASYGDAWKDYRISTYIDRAVVKTKRLRNLDMAGEPVEKMLDQALDLINEMAFLVIKLRGWDSEGGNKNGR
jgi:hypothetical protein